MKTGTGYATYILKILLKENRSFFAIRVRTMATSFSIFINDKYVSSSGLAGMMDKTTIESSQKKKNQ